MVPPVHFKNAKSLLGSHIESILFYLEEIHIYQTPYEYWKKS